MPSPEPHSAISGSLATLLGCPAERREYAAILESTKDVIEILTRDLGEGWVSRFVPNGVIAELESDGGNSSERHSPRQDKNHLFGLGLPSAYVALSLNLGIKAQPGLRLLQACLFAGLLILRQHSKKPAKTHLDVVATFLIGARDASNTRVKDSRVQYLANLGSSLNVAKIKNETASLEAELPTGFFRGISEVLEAIGRSKLTAAPRTPKAPEKPITGFIRGPRTPSPTTISTLVKNPTPDIEVISSGNFPLSPEEIKDAIEQAEAEAERAPAAIGAQSEYSPEVGFHERAALAKTAFLDVRHGLWCRNQWDALSQAEMRFSVEMWFARAEQAFAQEDSAQIESSLLVLLTGCTGWGHEQLWHTPFIQDIHSLPDGHQRAIFLGDGEVSFLVPGKGARYDPRKRGHVQYVLPVLDRVTLKLPLKLVHLINRYSGLRPSQPAIWLQNDLSHLLDCIRTHQEKARLEEPRETLVRIRNAHLLELLNAGQDLPLAQLASGELLGTNDVGLAYASFPTKKVQELHSQVCSNHGYGQTETSAQNDLVGGSHLQVSTETVRSVSAHNRAGLGQPFGYLKASKSEKLQLQNSLAPAVAWQLCVGTSLRPSDYVGTLTIRNFSMQAKCAVFAEKVLDEGHIGRLVPICPTLMKTLEGYGHHLSALSIDEKIPDYLKKAATLALSGDGPLFFSVGHGKTQHITCNDLSRRLPRTWKLPLNTFRHRLASELRKKGCPGVYVEALLGHIEVGTQPFGSESFMDPLMYLETTSNAIEQLLIEDGWKSLHGLPASDNPAWEPRPFGPWVQRILPDHLSRIESMRNEHQDALNTYRTSELAGIKERVADALKSRVPTFFTSKNGTIDQGDIRDLRKELTRENSCLAEIEIVITVLRENLIQARDDRGWKIAKLPYFHRGPVEASPFGTEFPAALDSFLNLRNFFTDVLNEKRKAPRAFTQRSRLILALILWHGVSDWNRLSNILKNLHRGRSIEGLPDAIVIPFTVSEDPICESAEILRGAVALAAANFVSDGRPIVATKHQIGSEIAGSLPSWLSEETGEPLLNVLLEAGKITQYFEHAPPLRDVWTGKASSVGLPLARIERLFSDRAIQLKEPEKSPIKNDPSNTVEGDSTSKHGAATKKQYAELRNVLRVPRARPKILTYSKKVLSLGIPDASLRTELTKEVDTYLEKFGTGDGICTLLAQYAKRLLNPNEQTNNVVRPRTVYDYVVHAGGSLSKFFPNVDLLSLEAEQLFDTYRLAVECSKPRYRPFVATYLSYFHTYLYREHSMPGVDLRSIGGSIAGIPDVGFIAPMEFQTVNRLLKSEPDESVMTSLYEHRKASQIFAIGYASGARSGEISRRERRDLVCMTDRVALLIRKNKLGSVKTRRSTRAISLDGWIEQESLKEIFDDSSHLFKGQKPRSPLFFDSDENEQPIDADVISGLIGSSLKLVTGDGKARQYWTRHNAASLGLLFLFADAALLSSINRDSETPIPFPIDLTAAEFSRLLGNHTELSQIHAAAFRGRLGHASMMTSITNYIHTFGLIEPFGSRNAFSYLTSQGIASIADKSHEWVRQTLHRANVSISDRASSRNTLVSALSTLKIDSVVDEDSSQPNLATTFALSTGAIRRCVECYLRTGNAAEAVLRLRASQSIQKNVLSMLLELDIVPLLEKTDPAKDIAKTKSIFTSTSNPQKKDIRVGERSIDSVSVNSLLKNIRKENKKQNSELDTAWNLILSGADPKNHLIRCKSKEEFLILAKGLSQILKESMPQHEAVVVIGENIEIVNVRSELETIEDIEGIKVIKRSLPLARDALPIALGVMMSTGGQLRLTSVLLAAIVRHILQKLFKNA